MLVLLAVSAQGQTGRSIPPGHHSFKRIYTVQPEQKACSVLPRKGWTNASARLTGSLLFLLLFAPPEEEEN